MCMVSGEAFVLLLGPVGMGGFVHLSKWPPQIRRVKEPPCLVPGLQHNPETGCEVHDVYIVRAAREKVMN